MVFFLNMSQFFVHNKPNAIIAWELKFNSLNKFAEYMVLIIKIGHDMINNNHTISSGSPKLSLSAVCDYRPKQVRTKNN